MYPITIEIPSDLRQLLGTSTIAERKQVETRDSNRTDKTKSITTIVPTSSMEISSVVKGNQVAVQSNGNTQGVLAALDSGNNVQVRLWNSTPESSSETNFEFAKLPEWACTERITTNLLPQLREERIQMVIEQARKPWSGLSMKNNRGPILIERNKDTIKLSYRQSSDTSKTLAGMPKVLAGRAKAILLGDSQDMGKENPTRMS